MTQEVLKLALEAMETELSIDWTNNDEFNASAEKMYEAITAIKEALAQPEQEPVVWADIQKEAQQIVESKFLWKQFIDGTPLANDIAVWMADFAKQHTTPPQRTEQNFCSRCGKRLGGINSIHTCTPPMEMNT